MTTAIAMPRRLRQRPKDHRGWPIPYTVARLPNGEPDFRVSDPDRWLTCISRSRCALCGLDLSFEAFWFVGGPLCERNRLFLDPAMHLDCAEYALRVCPFLAIPKAHYSNVDKRPAPGFAVIPEASAVKPDRFMLGRAASCELFRHKRDGAPAIRASRWLELRWWRDGAEIAGVLPT